jgi:hypothetical protein
MRSGAADRLVRPVAPGSSAVEAARRAACESRASSGTSIVLDEIVNQF